MLIVQPSPSSSRCLGDVWGRDLKSLNFPGGRLLCAKTFHMVQNNNLMTYVITENCIKCKYTDCVEVCPVDCFHEGPNFLVINPDECIDCSLCVPECPIDAIISDEDITDENRQFLELNERLSKKWPVLTEFKPAPDDAKEWENKDNKIRFLEE